MSDTGLTDAARRISIQLTADDLARANMLHFRRTIVSRRTVIRLVIFWAIFMAIFLLLLSLLGEISTLLPFIAIYAASTLVGVFAVPLLVVLIFNGRAARKRFARDKPMQVPRTMEWDESGYRSQNQYGSVIMPWQEFIRAEENDRYILIYSVENYRIIPKRSLSDGQLHDLMNCMKNSNQKLLK